MASQKTQNDHRQNGTTLTKSQVVVVMVPLPAQGHLNQLLNLSRLISSYDIPVHYVGTATHNRQAKVRVNGWNPLAVTNINFLEFQSSSFPTPPPNPNSSNKFPSQLIPSFKESANLREPVYKFVQELSTKSRRVVVIYDSLRASVVQDVPSIPNAETYCFQSTSAFSILSFLLELLGQPIPPGFEILKDVGSMQGCFTQEFLEFCEDENKSTKQISGNLYNTSKVIEDPFLEQLSKLFISETNNQWAIGPLNPVLKSEEKNSNPRHECLDWLDKQAPKSVIFVSFGTTTSLSDEQIQELAIGLEQSDQSFILVVREADRGDVFVQQDRKAQLPKGYEDRIKERGLVMRDWAPQLEILGHKSIGGFMSHCGWNSCMESMSMGVPIAAWPMHSDQPRNAILIAKVLKNGIIVRDWEKSEELVESKTIEDCVRRLMDSPEGEEMRKKAEELSNAIKESLMEGGVTRKEMDSFISHITR